MRWNPLRIPAAVVAALVLVVTLAGPAPAAVVAGPAADQRRRLRPVPRRERRRRGPPRTGVNIYDCNGAANQAWTFTAAGELRVYDAATLPRRRRPGHHRPGGRADLHLQRRRQPEVAAQHQRHHHRRAVRACASTSPDAAPPTAPRSGCGPATGRRTRAGRRRCAPPTPARRRVPGNPRVSNLTCSSRDVRLERLDGQRRRRVLRHLPRRPADEVGQRHHAVDQPARGRRARPGACTSTPATPPATCRRPARR